MITVNFENAVMDTSIAKYQKKVQILASKMERLESTGYEYLGWKDLPLTYDKVEFKEIKKTVKQLIKLKVDTLVVIGIGGSFAGAKAAIKMVQGNYGKKRKMKIVFAGESFSSTDLAQKMSYVQNKNFAINVISKSGQTLETAIAFRFFKKLLEERVGTNNAKKYIVVTTDANNGLLLKVAKSNSYQTFVIPDNIGGRFSVLTAVGLFPMACAGLDVNLVLSGAQKAHKKFSSDSLSTNLAYQYAVARHILAKRFQVELMVQYEPQMRAFSEWWKQLAGESEGKNQSGLFPSSAVFSTDLHSLGQFIQSGSKVLFETVITIKEPTIDLKVFEQQNDSDELNYLSKKSLHQINNIAFSATTDAHVRVGKVPNIHIMIEQLNENAFGQLVVFFQRAVAMTAYLQNVNPFNQPGVEVYKLNMFKELKDSEE